jgi:nitroimidazol reductase NimA-like FMN-containing flavoprotein (pyridoxamine 5'-phosphate oxidase superfamily)
MALVPRLDGNGLEVLDRAECLARLSRGGVGRLGFVGADSTLAILPVNFAVWGDEIVIRARAGGAIHGVGEIGAAVAFEIDELDPAYHGGRSVLVRGHARLLTGPREPPAGATLPPAWANNDANVIVCVSTEEVTGRRIPHRSQADLRDRSRP